PVVPPEHHVELPGGGIFEEVVELGIDVGLHGGSILVVETATRPDGVGLPGRGALPSPRWRAPKAGATSGDRPAYSAAAALAAPSDFMRELLRMNVLPGSHS